jgi:hypothetical protein
VVARTLKVVPKDRTKNNIQRYYMSLDFVSLWEDFYLELDSDGLFKWKTVAAFILHVVKGRSKEDNERIRFLNYFLGPDRYDVDLYAKYPFCKPQDWRTKRETGGWYNDESVKQAAKLVKAQQDSFGTIREAGREVTLPILVKVSQLSAQIDAAFEFRPFLDPTKPENIARAKLYFDFQERAAELHERYTALFAKQNGINFDDFESFQQVVLTQLKIKEQSGSKDDSYRTLMGRKVQEIVGQISTDHAEKAAVYDLPLSQIEHDAAVAVEVDMQKKKKVH